MYLPSSYNLGDAPQSKENLSSHRNVDELLIQVTVEMNFKGITPSEKSQSQNVTYCIVPFK